VALHLHHAARPLLPRTPMPPPPLPVLHGVGTSKARSRRAGVRGRPEALLLPPPPLRGPRRAKLALEVGVGVACAARTRCFLRLRNCVAPPKSTNPISTRCTARSRCPIAPIVPCPQSRSAAQAGSFSPPTQNSPAPNSAPCPARPAAHRENEVGGSGGRLSAPQSRAARSVSFRTTNSCKSSELV
jgi:hypothetical protein